MNSHNMNTTKYPAYSVCMSVYKNDNPTHFLSALRSMAQQTVVPAEIVLVVDGPVTESLETVIQLFTKEYRTLKVVRFANNQGLAKARQAAVTQTTQHIIAVMDSDDIAVPNRIELQIQYLLQHPETDVVGGQIEEFIDTPNNIVGKRIVPCSHEELMQYMKARCPFNHVTILVKKSALVQAGGYIDWHYNEDYYLWIRMALANCRFANLPDTLVRVRVGKEMYKRRGGWKYFKSERGIQRLMLQKHIISLPRYCYNVLIRFILQVVMPNRLRGWVFQTFARK